MAEAAHVEKTRNRHSEWLDRYTVERFAPLVRLERISHLEFELA